MSSPLTKEQLEIATQRFLVCRRLAAFALETIDTFAKDTYGEVAGKQGRVAYREMWDDIIALFQKWLNDPYRVPEGKEFFPSRLAFLEFVKALSSLDRMVAQISLIGLPSPLTGELVALSEEDTVKVSSRLAALQQNVRLTLASLNEETP